MTHFRNWLFSLAITLSLFTLASCGGSGGGSESTKSEVSGPATAVQPIDPASVQFTPNLSYADKVAIVFPDSWSREDSQSLGEPDIIAAFMEPWESPDDQVRESVFLVKVNTMDEARGSGLSNIQEISSRELEVAGFAAEEIIFDADVEGADGINLRFMLTGFEFDGSVYAMLYIAERSVFDRNTEIVRYMASNLRVGQGVIDGLDLNSDLSQPGKPALASDGSNFLLVSCRKSVSSTYRYDLVGRILTENREMGPEFKIHEMVDTGNTGCRYTSYNATYDGANYLITYMTYIDGIRRIAAKRVSTDGVVIDEAPLDISQNTAGSAFEPDLVFDGARTLVVWSEAGITQSIKGAFVNQSGGVTSSFVIEDNLFDTYADPNNAIYSAHAAYGNNQFMVIWGPHFFQDTRRESGMPIFGQLLDLNGNLLLTSPVNIRSDNGDNPRYPQIASDGSNYVVSWIEGLLDTNTTSSGSFTVYARQINSYGELVDATATDPGIEISPPTFVSNNPSEEVPKDFLDLSYHNESYLFLWSSVNFDPETGVYGVKASQSLSDISAATPIAGLEKDSLRGISRPSQVNAAYSNTESLVVWPSRDGVVEGWFIDSNHFD